MDDSIMFGWSANSFEELQNPNFQTNQSTIFLDEIFKLKPPSTVGTIISNSDPFRLLQGHLNEQRANDSIIYNSSYNFGANSQLKDRSSEYEAFGSSKKQQLQRSKMVSKAFVPPQNRDHIIAERKRREKLNQRFIELSSIIPYLKKSDKASILMDAVKYVKELQAKVNSLESQNPKPIDSVVLVKTSLSSSNDADDHNRSSCTKPLPEIHAKHSGNSILISIHCENDKGVLVKILSEIEGLNFIITHTNLVPLASPTVFMTITAQVEDSCTITMEDVVRKLDLALQQFKINKKEGN